MNILQILELAQAAEAALLPIIQAIISAIQAGNMGKAEKAIPSITPQAKTMLVTYINMRKANLALIEDHMAKELGVIA